MPFTPYKKGQNRHPGVAYTSPLKTNKDDEMEPDRPVKANREGGKKRGILSRLYKNKKGT